MHRQQTLLLQLGDILGLAGGGDHGEAVGAERVGGGEADAAGAAGDKHEGWGMKIILIGGQHRAEDGMVARAPPKTKPGHVARFSISTDA